MARRRRWHERACPPCHLLITNLKLATTLSNHGLTFFFQQTNQPTKMALVARHVGHAADVSRAGLVGCWHVGRVAGTSRGWANRVLTHRQPASVCGSSRGIRMIVLSGDGENLIMGYVVGSVDDTSCCLGSLNGVAAEGGVLRIWLLGCRVWEAETEEADVAFCCYVSAWNLLPDWTP
jgi:hypothetical protein